VTGGWTRPLLFMTAVTAGELAVGIPACRGWTVGETGAEPGSRVPPRN
jgi:hypothetical protein